MTLWDWIVIGLVLAALVGVSALFAVFLYALAF
jgi:hypothetical protein